MADREHSGNGGRPIDRLKSEAAGLVGALGTRAVSSVRDRLEGTTSRLNDYVADNGSGPGLMAAMTGAKGMAEGKGPVRSMLGAGFSAIKEKFRGKGKGGGQGKKLKVTNIVESIDVGVPLQVAYNQWTQFGDFPGFMKKVESVEVEEDGQKLNWKAQVLWSHRTWESTILEQKPDERIVWRGKGAKGYVDGSVTFHPLAPNLTRILVVLEYHPQGLFEHTGNIWRAQGRRVRLELKHFRRHVMAEAILHADEIEGWRGVIEDSEVVKDHETALQEEQDEDRQARGEAEPEEEEQEGEEQDIEARGQRKPAQDQDEDFEEDGEDEEDKESEPEDDERRRRGNGSRTGRAAAPSGHARSRRPSGSAPRSGRTGRGEEGSRRAARGTVTRRGGSL